VEHALAVTREDTITAGDLPAALRRRMAADSPTIATTPSAMSRADALNDAEKNYLIALLQQNEGNVSRAARQADISRQGLHKLLKKYGLEAREHRS
jgi:transcriptional regulator of acetoin/glycerol metabolism